MDFRVEEGFRDDPKIKALYDKLEDAGVLALITLWGYATRFRSDGVLRNMNQSDIEEAAKWHGKKGELVRALRSKSTTFLDYSKQTKTYSLHNWSQRNPWASNKSRRSRAARANVQKRWDKRLGDTTPDTGVSASGDTPLPPPLPNPSPNPLPKRERAPETESELMKRIEDKIDPMEKEAIEVCGDIQNYLGTQEIVLMNTSNSTNSIKECLENNITGQQIGAVYRMIFEDKAPTSDTLYHRKKLAGSGFGRHLRDKWGELYVKVQETVGNNQAALIEARYGK